MVKTEYPILCKNGIVRVKGYITDTKALVWADVWNDSHYVGFHKLNNGKWGIDDLNTGLDVAGCGYATRKDAVRAYEEIWKSKLLALYNSATYKQQAWRFTQKLKVRRDGK